MRTHAARPYSPATDGKQRALRRLAPGRPGEEIIPLVVDDDERGEVAHLDLPDRLHPQLGVLQHVDLGDAVLCQFGRGSADRAKIETAVRLAGGGYRGRPVAFGEHHQRTT